MNLTPETKHISTTHEIVAPVKQEYKKIGTIILKTGMKLYTFTFDNLMIEEVKINRKESAIDIHGKQVKNAQAIYNPKALYIQALNMKNAQRKVLKWLRENKLIK